MTINFNEKDQERKEAIKRIVDGTMSREYLEESKGTLLPLITKMAYAFDKAYDLFDYEDIEFKETLNFMDRDNLEEIELVAGKLLLDNSFIQLNNEIPNYIYEIVNVALTSSNNIVRIIKAFREGDNSNLDTMKDIIITELKTIITNTVLLYEIYLEVYGKDSVAEVIPLEIIDRIEEEKVERLFFYLNYTLISKDSLEYSLNKDLIEDQTEEDEDETEEEKLEDFLEGL